MPFEQNSYVVWREGAKSAIVCDPGFDPMSIAAVLEEHGLGLAAQLITHGHADHIAGIEALKRAFPDAPVVIGAHEAKLLVDANLNQSAKYGFPITTSPADALVDDGELFTYAGMRFLTREVPGHSPGSVVFIIQDVDPAVVLGGDVLFAGSVGRTDLDGGSFPLLASGIKQKLFVLADDTIVLSGHGPATTIGEEKRTNPFVGSGG